MYQLCGQPMSGLDRVRPMTIVLENQAKDLEHSLKHYGYRPAIKYSRYYLGSWPDVIDDNFYSKCARKPEVLYAYHRYERKSLDGTKFWGISWFNSQGDDALTKFRPAIFRTLDGVIEDEDGKPKTISGDFS